jgi:hypothetical protein
MTNTGWFSRFSNPQPASAILQRVAAGVGTAILLMMTSVVIAQTPAATATSPDTPMTTPNGYSMHQSIDFGGRMAGISGSNAMYSTLVNQQSGPRVLGETFELHSLPGVKHTLLDSMNAFGSGFGGDPYNFAKLDFSKGKAYEFSGLFRRDRQYFDYDLLGNPNIPGGQTIPIGPTGAPTGTYAWPQVNQSPFLFNTVRRMTDTNITIFPISRVTFRAGYSQNIFQGPSLTPSGYQFAGSKDVLLQENQRNSTDDFMGAIDWKPVSTTKLTFEEQIDHYKADSNFSMDPSYYNVQEANGTPVALLANYDALTPYTSSSCNANSVGTTPMLSAPQTAGGLPVINAACAVITSYTRYQPTRIIYPTEIFRLQSTSIKNVSMNGDIRYTNGNMSLPNYYDSFQGLSGTTRAITYTGNASAKREVMAADYGIAWQVAKTFSIEDEVTFSSAHQPGTAVMTSGTTLSTPATAGNETINYAGTLTTTTAKPGASTFEGSPAIGTPLPGYYGQNFLTNNLTGTWDAASNATLSLTYRHVTHTIAQGVPHNLPMAVTAENGTITINENGGVFNAAVRPTANWDLNGSVEMLYADNAFTPVGARQTKHYRVHTLYRPKPWATISAAFNDSERHNNTNNNQALTAEFVPATPTTVASGTPYEGPLNHVDRSRVFSVGAVLQQNEHYGLDFNYSYSDVYTATNICYDNGATATLPGAVGSATATPCPNVFGRGATAGTEYSGAALTDWFARDFMDAPTQFGSVAVNLSPEKSIHSNIGYRISSVNGSQFFNDARSVNGSLVSTYQSPFVNASWTARPGLIWKAEYNFFGYGEGGPSGSQYCSTSTTPTSTVVPCTSLYNPLVPTTVTGLVERPSGLTAPRNFHANNVVLSVHYEF